MTEVFCLINAVLIALLVLDGRHSEFIGSLDGKACKFVRRCNQSDKSQSTIFRLKVK